MRQRRVFAFLFSLLIAHYAQATPIHVDVKGTIDTSFSAGPSPIANGSKVTGWYELDWDKAKYEVDDLHSTIYSGILTYEFTIAGLTLTGMDPNIQYHSSTHQISPNSENMMFRDLYPNSFHLANFLDIEDLYFYISNTNGVRKASFSYDSITDFEHEYNTYSGWCDLTDASTHVAEPSPLIIFLFGLASILLARVKQRIK